MKKKSGCFPGLNIEGKNTKTENGHKWNNINPNRPGIIPEKMPSLKTKANPQHSQGI